MLILAIYTYARHFPHFLEIRRVCCLFVCLFIYLLTQAGFLAAMQLMWACGLRLVFLEFYRVLIYQPTKGWTAELAVGLWWMVLTSTVAENFIWANATKLHFLEKLLRDNQCRKDLNILILSTLKACNVMKNKRWNWRRLLVYDTEFNAVKRGSFIFVHHVKSLCRRLIQIFYIFSNRSWWRKVQLLDKFQDEDDDK